MVKNEQGLLAYENSGDEVKELILIGTVHRDPGGAEKLRKILTKARPVAVAVEVSPYGLFYRHKNGRRLHRQLMRRVKRLANELRVSWRRWGQIDAIQTQLRSPFEYRTAQNYCRDNGAMLFCVDSSHWSKRWIHDQWQHLLSSKNLKALLKQLPEDLRDEVGRDYKMATLLLAPEDRSLISAFAKTWSADLHWQQRETDLARVLEGLYYKVDKGRLAYVGGWQHLLGPNAGGTLYERLEHLQPRRVLLDEGKAWGIG